MTQIEDALEKLGLTQNEITIFTYLIKKGASLGSEIYHENELDKSSAYEALSDLQDKKLVFALGAKRNQRFESVPATELLELVSKKELELHSVKDNIKQFINDIESFANTRYKNRNITIFEGDSSYKAWVHAKHGAKKGSVIREFVSYRVHEEYTPDFEKIAAASPTERAKKGIYLKSLTTKEDLLARKKKHPTIYTSSQSLLKEIRVLPDEPKIDIPASVSTFDNKIAFLRKKDGQFFGLIIEDGLLCSLMNSMSDFMWHYSEEV